MRKACGSRLFESDALRAWRLEHCHRRWVTIESRDDGMLRRGFEAVYEAFQEGGPVGEEPMLNILGFHLNDEWRIHNLPPGQASPVVLLRAGGGATADQPRRRGAGRALHNATGAGLWERENREHIAQMYQEVCVPAERFAGMTARLRARLAGLAGEKGPGLEKH